MRARLAIVGAVVGAALAGCGSLAQAPFDLGSGDANYDALKAATQTCQAQGGQVRLKDGFDGRQMSSYQCVVGKPR